MELANKEILKKFMKKVMPFVAAVRERVEQLGKVAMAVTVDFDEKEILTVNLEYLKSTLGLDSIEIFFTDDPAADQKTKEEVRPGSPLIMFSTKPAVKVAFENPIPRSGYFTQFINVSEGDTVKDLKEKLAKALTLKEINGIQLWRFEDPVLGPRKIPNFNDFKTGKVQVEEGTLSIDVTTDAVAITSADDKKVDVGTSLIYVVA